MTWYHPSKTDEEAVEWIEKNRERLRAAGSWRVERGRIRCLMSFDIRDGREEVRACPISALQEPPAMAREVVQPAGLSDDAFGRIIACADGGGGEVRAALLIALEPSTHLL